MSKISKITITHMINDSWCIEGGGHKEHISDTFKVSQEMAQNIYYLLKQTSLAKLDIVFIGEEYPIEGGEK